MRQIDLEPLATGEVERILTQSAAYLSGKDGPIDLIVAPFVWQSIMSAIQILDQRFPQALTVAQNTTGNALIDQLRKGGDLSDPRAIAEALQITTLALAPELPAPPAAARPQLLRLIAA